MRLRLSVLALLAFASSVGPGPARAGDPPIGVSAQGTLVEGKTTSIRLPRGTDRWLGRFEVPDGVKALHAFVSSPVDVDIELRPGVVAPKDAVVRGDDDDLVADGVSGDEHLMIPEPEAGTWTLILRHPASRRGFAPADVAFVLSGRGRPEVLVEGQGLDVGKVSAWPLRAVTWGPSTRPELVVNGPRGVSVRATGRDVPAGRAPRAATHGATLRLGEGDGVPRGFVPLEVLPQERTLRGKLEVAVDPAPKEKGPRALRLGVPVEFKVTDQDKKSRVAFRLEVPAGCPGIDVSVVGEKAQDFDLFVRRGMGMDDPAEECHYVALRTGDEDGVHLGGSQGLPAGEYEVLVESIGTPSSPEATLLAEVRTLGDAPRSFTQGPGVALPLGRFQAGQFEMKQAYAAWFDVAVPEGAKKLEIQVVDASSDLDLYVTRQDTGEIVGRSLGEIVDEHLEVPLTDALRGLRRLSIGVANRLGSEPEARFRVAVEADRRPGIPGDLRFPPFHKAADLNPTERLAECIVELSVRSGGGSAVCVHPSGFLVTCSHVLEDPDEPGGLQSDGILVAFPDDFRDAPRQRYLARRIASDSDLDLAVIRIVSDVYGRPLPKDLALPHVQWGAPGSLRLGDPLWTVGYPESGSERSRTGVIVSRGVVAGLETARGALTWIKTDAWIGHGHSGGGVFTEDGRWVGVACATMGDHERMALCRPCSAIPPLWRLPWLLLGKKPR